MQKKQKKKKTGQWQQWIVMGFFVLIGAPCGVLMVRFVEQRGAEDRSVLEDLLPLCDMVLIMTVEPGFGGQKFMADMLPKVTWLANKREELGLAYRIQVDGGVGAGNAPDCVKAGADVLVAGSSVMGQPDLQSAAEAVLAAARGVE